MARTRRDRDVTLADVALAAGVSIATVSRAFSRPDLLSDATIEHVRAVAADLGYVGNQAARALVTGRFHNLAMVVPDIANPFFPPLVRAIQDHAGRLGYAVFLGDSDEQAERERTLLHRFSGQVEGFVLAGTRLDEDAVREVSRLRPTVLVNRDVPSVSRVLVDSGQGIREAVRHLRRLGHRGIVYLAGPRESWSDQQRRAAAAAAAIELGMSCVVVEVGRPTFDGGSTAVDAVLATTATGVIAFDDVVAHGALAGLHARGLEVPRDLSVIGCDDALPVETDPALTTIAHSSDAAGAAVVDLLARGASSARSRARRVTIPTRLVPRRTTAAPPRG